MGTSFRPWGHEVSRDKWPYLGICVFEALSFEALLDEQSCLGVFSLEVLKVWGSTWGFLIGPNDLGPYLGFFGFEL